MRLQRRPSPNQASHLPSQVMNDEGVSFSPRVNHPTSPLSPHPLAIEVSLCEPDCRQPLSAANDAGTLRLLQSILSAWLHLQRGF